MAETKSRLTKPLGEWGATDVLALIEERIEEGQRLEFKRQLDLDTPKQRSEVCKDTSGLANSQGGLLIYGVEEEEQDDGRRIPIRPTPLSDGEARSRLEDVLDSTVHPSLNMEARQIETDGGYFLVLRAFPRLGPPHMVDGYGEMRFYVRAGLKTRPMTQREIETAFSEAVRSEGLASQRLARLPLAVLPEGVERERSARGADRTTGPWLGVLTLPIDAPDPLLPMQEADSRTFPDDGDYRRWSRSDLGLTLNWDADGYHGDLYDEEWRGDYSVDGLLDDLAGATREAMDRIFVAYGLARCFYFDAEGAPVEELCGQA